MDHCAFVGILILLKHTSIDSSSLFVLIKLLENNQESNSVFLPSGFHYSVCAEILVLYLYLYLKFNMTAISFIIHNENCVLQI